MWGVCADHRNICMHRSGEHLQKKVLSIPFKIRLSVWVLYPAKLSATVEGEIKIPRGTKSLNTSCPQNNPKENTGCNTLN